MNLLVLAQTPPPLHGQSAMVRAGLDGLRREPDFVVRHVELRLSADHADIGRWRPAKALRTAAAVARTLALRLRHGPATLYYVPAPPAKRGALYRDWFVLALCRPWFRHLVLHWHAAGLASWLATEATAVERAVTRLLLGRAALALVLSPSLRDDATALASRRIAVVPNGLPDPGPPPPPPPGPGFPALFLGLCSEEKGLFAAAAAVIAANRRVAPGAPPVFTLVAAGAFPDTATADRFAALALAHPELRHAGFVDGAAKEALFAAARCLLFPTHYPAEGQPLVVLEALARDRPVVATRWRALPDLVPPDCGRLVPVGDADALAAALLDLRDRPPAPGVCRARFLAHGTLPAHLAALAAALRPLAADQPVLR